MYSIVKFHQNVMYIIKVNLIKRILPIFTNILNDLILSIIVVVFFAIKYMLHIF